PAILRQLKPGGVLLAQGPLEANANLFFHAIRLARRLRRGRTLSFPPYHVMLATAQGQRKLFSRHGLTEREFDIEEVSWPAPDRLFGRSLPKPRDLILFALRRASQALSRVRGGDW